jgi:hypothetical protein
MVKPRFQVKTIELSDARGLAFFKKGKSFKMRCTAAKFNAADLRLMGCGSFGDWAKR